jgi:hypothetical protein
MSLKRIRGQEVNIMFTIDGVPQKHSFTNVMDFNVSQQAEVTKTDHVGKNESTLDFQHSGWDFDFSLQVSDPSLQAFIKKIVGNDASHVAYPVVNMTVAYNYRDPSIPRLVQTYMDAVIKGDESFGSRKDFVTFKMSGSAERRI